MKTQKNNLEILVNVKAELQYCIICENCKSQSFNSQYNFCVNCGITK